jgi:hypothetical protein
MRRGNSVEFGVNSTGGSATSFVNYEGTSTVTSNVGTRVQSNTISINVPETVVMLTTASEAVLGIGRSKFRIFVTIFSLIE